MTSRKMIEATNRLAKYFGLFTQEDLASLIALDEVNPGQATNPNTFNPSSAPAAIKTAIELIIETSRGCYTTRQMLQKLKEAEEGLTDEEKRRLRRIINIFSGPERDTRFLPDDIEGREDTSRHRAAGMAEILAPVSPTAESSSQQNESTLSVIYSNSRKVVPGAKNLNALTIFLNGVPTHELNLATPFLDIQFFTPRSPRSPDGKIQGSSLLKFLIGAQKADDGSITAALADANRVSGSILSPGRENAEYTLAGMEMFTSPQTLVNADESYDRSLRSARVLNKFLPPASLRSFDVTIQGTTGMMSFKSGTLTFVIHDRSRLSEFADFIRPDLYGSTEIQVEYGYIHPNPDDKNPYSILLHEMRAKEKYGITNSSFTFDDSGQVIVSLNIAMRGGIDTRIANIAGPAVSQQIQQMRELGETINRLRERVFRTDTGMPSREIRGVQILDIASDQNAQLVLDNNTREQAKELNRSLTRASRNPDAGRLRTALSQLYGDLTRSDRFDEANTRNDSLRNNVRRTVSSEINDKIKRLSRTPDPMLRFPDGVTQRQKRNADPPRASTQDDRRARNRYDQLFAQLKENDLQEKIVSLAKLLSVFVGDPLVETGNFSEVQLLFYPFNDKAGFAQGINIGEFAVDLLFFSQEYTRYRLENLSRAGNMSVRDFLSFVASTILDDPAAPSYGLFDPGSQVIASRRRTTPTPAPAEPEEPARQRQDRNLAEGGSIAQSGARTVRGEEAPPAAAAPETPAPRPARRQDRGNLFQEARVTGGRNLTANYAQPELNERMERILRDVTGGQFRMPMVEFMIECLPGRVDEEGEDSRSGDNLSILRLHVFDKVNSSYSTISEILQAQRNDALNSLSALPRMEQNTPVSEENKQEASAVIEQALETQLIKRNREPIGSDGDESDFYVVTGGPQAMRDFLYKSVPYIIYGSAGSVVKKASVNTIQDAALNTVNLLRNLRADPLQPNGEQPGGMPLSLIPAEGSIDILGCPLFEYTQQFFIDFQTGTSLDDIYAITEINHRFDAGDFTTIAKLVPISSYGQYNSFTEKVREAAGIVGRYERERREREAEAQ